MTLKKSKQQGFRIKGAKRSNPEYLLQKSIIQWMKCQLRDCLYFHVPNGGKRSASEGARFKAMGVLAGVADILIFKDGEFYAIELKAGKNKQEITQIYFQDRWQEEGGKYAIVKSIDELKVVLKKWGIKSQLDKSEDELKSIGINVSYCQK